MNNWTRISGREYITAYVSAAGATVEELAANAKATVGRATIYFARRNIS